jgi:monofunctional biosynthetic peptidoglycan transglycosylase
MKNRVKKTVSIILILFAVTLISYTIFFLISLPNVSSLIKSNPSITAMMKQRIREAKKHKKKLYIKQKWVSLNKIPKLLIDSVILTEDALFYHHNGVDYHELKEAIKKNIKKGSKVRGGSTITQQLAKNLYLSTHKSYLRKLKEFFIAKRLEKHLSKDRILEIYLNVIEFGRGIFGVEAASFHFFKKPVSQLSLEEIVRLVAVIPKPLRVSPFSKSKYLKWRINLILKKLKIYKKLK